MLRREGRGWDKKRERREKQDKCTESRLALCWFCVLLVFAILYYLQNVRAYFPAPYQGKSSVCAVRPRALSNEAATEYHKRQKYGALEDVYVLPHPLKAHYGGEDAVFWSMDGRSFGVADGVGGWNLEGVNPSEFSRALMRGAESAVNDDHLRDPLDILCRAEESVVGIVGSCTALVCSIDGDTLHYANVGDSALMIVRGTTMVHRSVEQQHEFNFPFQVGTYGDGLDLASEVAVPLQHDDVILVGSDGLFDNVSEEQLVSWISSGVTAQHIAMQAMSIAHSLEATTPFSVAAQKAGQDFVGGKVDDITVVMVRVVAQ